MAKYAIPAEVVFTFDDEPVDIQEMLHDNAESEEVVEGLERLLKAVAAPGFTEAEVVFDIGGGISVVRAARRTANPRPKSRVFEVEETHGLGARTWQAYGEATVATVDGYKVAYQSRSFSNEQGQAGRAIPLNKATRYYALKADGTPDLDAYASKQSRGWSLTGGGDYGSDRFSNRRAALAYLSRVNLPGVREDNPRDDGQQSLPLDYDRTGNPPRQRSSAYIVERFTAPLTQQARQRGETPREIVLEATPAKVDGYHVAYLSREGDSTYTRDKAPRFYALKPDGTPDPTCYADKQAFSRGWTLTGVQITDNASNRREALAYLAHANPPDDRTGNPHDYRSGDIPFQRRWIANLQRELTEAKDADTVLSTLNTLADGLPAMWAYYPKPDFCAKTFMVLDGKTDAVRFTAKDLDTLYRIVQHGFDVREPGFPRDHAAKLAHYLTGKVFHVHYVDNFTENKPFFEKVSKSVTADLQKWIDDRYGKGLFVVDNCWVWWANSFVDQSILVYPTVAFGPVLLKSLKSVLKRVLKPTRTGNPHGGGLVSGYGINTFAMDPDDYAPERQSNPRESIATMLGRPRR